MNTSDTLYQALRTKLYSVYSIVGKTLPSNISSLNLYFVTEGEGEESVNYFVNRHLIKNPHRCLLTNSHSTVKCMHTHFSPEDATPTCASYLFPGWCVPHPRLIENCIMCDIVDGRTGSTWKKSTAQTFRLCPWWFFCLRQNLVAGV